MDKETLPTVSKNSKKSGCFKRLRRSKWWKRSGYLTVAISTVTMASSYAVSTFYTLQNIEDLFNRTNFFALDIVNYPAVILCNSNQIRKSYIAEVVTGDVLNLLENFPHSWHQFTDKLTHLDSLNSTEFFTGAAQLKKNFIVGCKQANGADCSYTDFDQTITDFGTCYALKIVVPETSAYADAIPTYDSPLEITVNLEAYDNLVKFDEPSSLKVAFLQPDGDSLIDERALDVTPGSFAQIALTYAEVSRHPSACQCSNTAKTSFYSKYTRHACKTEKHSQSIVSKCGCKSYNSHANLGSPVCKVSEHLGCTLKKKKKRDLITTDDCPNSCQSQHFEADLTISQLSSEQANDSLNLISLLELFGSFMQLGIYKKPNDRSSELISFCNVFLSTYQQWQNLPSFQDSNESCLKESDWGPLTHQLSTVVFMHQQEIFSILNLVYGNYSIEPNLLGSILLTSVKAVQLALSADSLLNRDRNFLNVTTTCATEIAESLTSSTLNVSAVYDCFQKTETELKAIQAASNDLKNSLHQLTQLQEEFLTFVDFVKISTSNLKENHQMHMLNDKCESAVNTNLVNARFSTELMIFQIFQSLLEVNMEELHSNLRQLRLRLNSLSKSAFNATAMCMFEILTRLSNFTETLNSSGQSLWNSALNIQLSNLNSPINTDCSNVDKQTEELVRNNLVKLQIYFKQEPNPGEYTGCCTDTGNQTANSNYTQGNSNSTIHNHNSTRKRNKPRKSQGKKCDLRGKPCDTPDLVKTAACIAGIFGLALLYASGSKKEPDNDTRTERPFSNRVYPTPPPPYGTQIPTPTSTSVNPTPTPSPTPVNPRPAPSPIPVSPTPTPNPTPVNTTPITLNPTPTPSPTPVKPTPTPVKPTPTPSPIPVNPTPTPSPIPVNPTPSPSPILVNPTPTPTPSPIPVSPTPTPNPTPINPTPIPVNPTPTPSPIPVNPTPTPSPIPVNPTPTPTPSPIPVSPTPTPNPTPINPTPIPVNPSPTPSPIPVNPTPSPSPIPVNPTPTPTPSPIPVSPTPTPNPTPINPTPIPVNPTPTPSPIPVNPTPTPSPIPVNPTPSPSPIPVNPTPTPTPSPIPVSPTPTPNPTPINPTPIPVNPTPTPSPTPVNPTPTPSPIPVNPTPTLSPTPVNPTPIPVNPRPTPSPIPVNPRPTPSPTPVNPTPTPTPVKPTPIHVNPRPTPSPTPVNPTPTPSPTPDNPTPKPPSHNLPRYATKHVGCFGKYHNPKCKGHIVAVNPKRPAPVRRHRSR